MVTEVEVLTAPVETVKVAVFEPELTTTFAGTVAAVDLLLNNETVAPAGGAGPTSVTVAVDVVPAVTEFGFNARVEGAGGLMVNETDWLTPYVAVILTEVTAATAYVVTGNVATVLPAGSVTMEGTLATEGVPLDKLTTIPPVGAG